MVNSLGKENGIIEAKQREAMQREAKRGDIKDNRSKAKRREDIKGKKSLSTKASNIICCN